MVLSLVTVLLGGMGLGGLLKVILDHKRHSRKQTDDMATSMVASMGARLNISERHGVLCEANLTALRHKQSNQSAAFDAFLLLVKAVPERLADHVALVEAMRAEHARIEAIERAEILKVALEAGGEMPWGRPIDEGTV